MTTDRLATTIATVFDPNTTRFGAPLLRLLARGEPVAIDRLAASLGRTVAEVQQDLAAKSDIEYDDDGRIVGAGITLRQTPHRFIVDGITLYTWCAMDTLVFPTILDRRARVESPCHATGTPIRLTVDADRIVDVAPATAVVSLVTPDDLTPIRSSFCNEVHFFASAEAAEPWLAAHPAGAVLPVAEAHRLGQSCCC